ncbi:MAG: F0F1 ATP synthase subunit A [Chloroflexi bacterium]|nr:F0F1 ATP synthase subunit A [Chloroflexota bacterium]
MTETPKQKVWGRWVVLAAFILGLFLFTGFFGLGLGIKVVMPSVVLPPEALTEPIQTPFGPFFISGTLIALLFADVLIIALAIAISSGVKKGNLILTGITGGVEALLEMLHGMTEGTAGKWTKAIFPWFATITLIVMIANWTELIPGVETIGLLEKSAHGEYAVQQVGPFQSIVKAEEGHGEYLLIPFVRVVSTDLNFTVALALVAVTMIQVFGIRAQGGAYFSKFWNTGTVFSKPIFGVIDFGVGLLEIVSEFSKVLSFAFRLFGNIFAGSVLLFVIGSLVPVFAQSIFYLLEFFVGAIQAFVFGLLAMTFMAQATQGHGGEHHEEAHA